MPRTRVYVSLGLFNRFCGCMYVLFNCFCVILAGCFAVFFRTMALFVTASHTYIKMQDTNVF